jgi:hypothetical protein
VSPLLFKVYSLSGFCVSFVIESTLSPWFLCLLCYSKYTLSLVFLSLLLLKVHSLPGFCVSFVIQSILSPWFFVSFVIQSIPSPWFLCLLCYSKYTLSLVFVSPLLFKVYRLPGFCVSFVIQSILSPCLVS